MFLLFFLSFSYDFLSFFRMVFPFFRSGDGMERHPPARLPTGANGASRLARASCMQPHDSSRGEGAWAGSKEWGQRGEAGSPAPPGGLARLQQGPLPHHSHPDGRLDIG